MKQLENLKGLQAKKEDQRESKYIKVSIYYTKKN